MSQRCFCEKYKSLKVISYETSDNLNLSHIHVKLRRISETELRCQIFLGNTNRLWNITECKQQNH